MARVPLTIKQLIYLYFLGCSPCLANRLSIDEADKTIKILKDRKFDD